MMESAAQAEYRARRKQDILDRITHALPDWSAEQLDILATQMAELEIRCTLKDGAAARSRPQERLGASRRAPGQGDPPPGTDA